MPPILLVSRHIFICVVSYLKFHLLRLYFNLVVYCDFVMLCLFFCVCIVPLPSSKVAYHSYHVYTKKVIKGSGIALRWEGGMGQFPEGRGVNFDWVGYGVINFVLLCGVL